MKAFIERVFMAKRNKEESVQDQATEAVVEAIVETKSKSDKHKDDCQCSTCLECLEWRK
jgi:hypothetical protein